MLHESTKGAITDFAANHSGERLRLPPWRHRETSGSRASSVVTMPIPISAGHAA